MGADKADRLYEELADHKKLATVLQDVSNTRNILPFKILVPKVLKNR